MKFTYLKDTEGTQHTTSYIVYVEGVRIGKVWKGSGNAGYYDAWRARSPWQRHTFAHSTDLRSNAGTWLWRQFAQANPYDAQVIERRAAGCTCDPDYSEASSGCPRDGWMVRLAEREI